MPSKSHKKQANTPENAVEDRSESQPNSNIDSSAQKEVDEEVSSSEAVEEQRDVDGQEISGEMNPEEVEDDSSKVEKCTCEGDVEKEAKDSAVCSDGSTEVDDSAIEGVSDPSITAEAVIEAILFATDEPVSPQKISDILGAGSVKEIRERIEQLNKKYETAGCAFRIEEIANGYQMLTLPQYNAWLKKLLKVRSESKLSPAALETLAIIAYKQPILRVDVEGIRGVAAGEMIRQLAEKGLVKIVGRAEVLGRPLLYGTTKKFLEVFGLRSLKDLPTADELKNPEKS